MWTLEKKPFERIIAIILYDIILYLSHVVVYTIVWQWESVGYFHTSLILCQQEINLFIIAALLCCYNSFLLMQDAPIDRIVGYQRKHMTCPYQRQTRNADNSILKRTIRKYFPKDYTAVCEGSWEKRITENK